MLCSFFRHGASKMGTAIPGLRVCRGIRTLDHTLGVSQAAQPFCDPETLDSELPRKDEKWLEDDFFKTLTHFLPGID